MFLRRLLNLLRDTLTVCILTVFLLEAALRVYHFVHPVFIFPDNSDRRFRGKPFGPDYGFTLNAGGFKDTAFITEKPDGAVRLIAIGDSFAFGVVPYQFNFLTLLEEGLRHNGDRYEVFNMGVPGTGPREYFSLLIKEALPLEPDAVVLCLFVGNDFIDVRSQPPLHRVYVAALAQYIYDMLYRVEGTQVFHSGPYEDSAATFDPDTFLDIEVARSGIYSQSNPTFHEHLAGTLKYIDQIKTLCDSRGTELIIVIIPDEVQVEPSLQRQVVKKLQAGFEDVDFELPNRLLSEELRRRGIKYLDLLQPFLERSKEERLYKLQDTHWNIAGNRLAAVVLRDFLEHIGKRSARTAEAR